MPLPPTPLHPTGETENTSILLEQHPVVTGILAGIQLHDHKTSFPIQSTERPLIGSDYQQFLMKINQKLDKTEGKYVFDELSLPCFNTSPLEGLGLYCAHASHFPYKTITFDLRHLSETHHESLMPSLKSALLKLSATRILNEETASLPNLKLIDNTILSLEMIQELIEFVKSNKIGNQITLPDLFKTHPVQRSLDEITLENSTHLSAQVLNNSPIQQVPTQRSKRSRPRLKSKQKHAIDIEVQQEQEQQAEVALETQLAIQEQRDDLTERKDLGLTLNDFSRALSRKKFSEYAKSHLIPGGTQAIKELWCNWVGALSLFEAVYQQSKTITQAACEEIMRYQDEFQYGIDFTRLPAGFSIRTDNDFEVLDFHPERKPLQKYDPLCVQTRDPAPPVPLTPSQFIKLISQLEAEHPIKLIVNRIESLPYHRAHYEVLRQYLPQMLLLSSESMKILAELKLTADQLKLLMEDGAKMHQMLKESGDENKLRIVLDTRFPGQMDQVIRFIQQFKLNHDRSTVVNLFKPILVEDQGMVKNLLEKNPTLSPAAVLQLYIRFGLTGIMKLNDFIKLNQPLWKELAPYLSKMHAYTHMIDPRYQEAMTAIKGLTPVERVWFNRLLAQHAAVHAEVNLIDLVNAFKAFKLELAKLTTDKGQTLTLPKQCDLTGIKSMPVALSRMLALLKHVNPINRQEQIEVIGQLDLSSHGMIKTLSAPDLRWAWVTPEMNLRHAISMKEVDPTRTYRLTGANDEFLVSYRAPLHWQYIKNDNKENTAERFFRYVAFQEKNGQLPLNFYQYTHQLLRKSDLSSEIQSYLYALIAGSTTTPLHTHRIYSIDQAKKSIKSLIEMKLPFALNMPGIKSRVQVKILELLYPLHNLPPLPLLDQLVQFISSSIMKEPDRLLKGSEDLQTYTERYPNEFYQGLRDYSLSDFKDGELFFSYLNVVEKIDQSDTLDHVDKQGLISNISSFHLQIKEIEGILKDYFSQSEMGFVTRRQETFKLISLLSHTNHPSGPLTSHDLRDLLDKIKNEPTRPVIDILRHHHLAAYFPDNMLDDYTENKLPDDINTLIERSFFGEHPAQIQRFLLKFNPPADSHCYASLVTKMADICASLTEFEKNIFLQKITSHDGLVDRTSALNMGHSFLKLLDLIDSRSPHVFINLLAYEGLLVKNSKEKKFTPHLAERAIMLMKTLLPASRKIEPRVISHLELTSRIMNTLLRIPSKQWTSSIDPSDKFIPIFKQLNQVAAKNPNNQKQLLELFDRHLCHYSEEQNGPLLAYLHEFINTLNEVLDPIEDKHLILSLWVQFNRNDNLFRPQNLLDLLNAVKKLSPSDQHLALKVASVLLANKKGYNLPEFLVLCTHMETFPPFSEALSNIYASSPYPSLNQILSWHDMVIGAKDQYLPSMKSIQDHYRVHRERMDADLPLNGFHQAQAREQWVHFRGVDQACIDVEQFEKLTLEIQSYPTHKLLDILRQYHPTHPSYQPNQNIERLVAVVAELLHRSKGSDEKRSDGSFVPGSSMELNTTQYLAILSSLKSKPHVTSQIGTGEGKSRIMMIMNACEWAQGKTVDFLTSDLHLSTRDYVEYHSFFELIGAQTSMIYAQSPPESYQKGGINFSDPANLSLFRNKAFSVGKGDKVIEQETTKRALLLDEADKTYFDVAETRFNFSTVGDKNKAQMEWIYPLFMQYFAQDKFKVGDQEMTPLELYFDDIDLSVEQFKAFASVNCTPTQSSKLKTLSDDQIEQWQVAAVTASQLQYQEDFIIEPNQLISTLTGPRIASEAQLIVANRASKHAKFSFGVHQCLHARLNLTLEGRIPTPDPALLTALKKCEHAFHIADEKQIVYSTTSKNLLDDYADGDLKAVTGTSGSLIERQEAAKLYGQGFQDMHFIDVPREKGLHRKDRPIVLVKNETQQLEALVNEIHQARARNQPILIVAENDKDSEALFNQLKLTFNEKIQHIHSQLSTLEENACIDQAGYPQQITVSTDMSGRGTDITLKGEALAHGLCVMMTYLPRERDINQIRGRAGRFGAPGETLLILNKNKLPSSLAKNVPKPKTPAFHHWMNEATSQMDRKAQRERLIKNTVGDFRKVITSLYYQGMLEQVNLEDHSKIQPAWVKFLEKTDKHWNETWPHIQALLQEDSIPIDQLDALLQTHREVAQSNWTKLKQDIQSLDVNGQDKDTHPASFLPATLPSLVLSKVAQTLLNNKRVTLPESGPLNVKTISTALFALVGLGVALALVLTGVLAPFGGLIAAVFFGILVSTAASALGAAIGFGFGSLIDYFQKKSQKAPASIPLAEEGELTHSHAFMSNALKGAQPQQSLTEKQASMSAGLFYSSKELGKTQTPAVEENAHSNVSPS